MPTDPDRKRAIETVAESCRILGKLDITHAAFGHVSYRLSENSMLIKAKGPDEVGLRYTSVEDIIEVDFDGNKVSGPDGLRPPSESFIHIWLMKQNPGVGSVIHVHPEHAVLLTICEKEILPIYAAYDGSGIQLALEGIPTYPRSITITDDVLGKDFADFMGDKKVALMRGHGVSVVGKSIEEATVRTTQLNRIVTMTYKAYAIGEPKPILSEDIEELTRRRADGRPSERGSAGGDAGTLASYRYYRRLTGEEEA